MEKFKFKVVVNNAGEILTFYTVTTSPNNAKRNALTQLAKKLGHHPASTIMRLKDRAAVSLASDDFIYSPERHGAVSFVAPRSLAKAGELTNVR